MYASNCHEIIPKAAANAGSEQIILAIKISAHRLKYSNTITPYY